MRVLLLGLCAGIRLTPKTHATLLSAASPEAEKHQAVLDYEVGENENAADPEQPVHERDVAKTKNLESEISQERGWTNNDESSADQASPDVLKTEKKATVTKKQRAEQNEEKASKVDFNEAGLDYQFGENAKATDPEQPDVARMDKNEDSLEKE